MTTRFLPTQWRDYALLDAGNGQRLERFGEWTLVRPDPFALWERAGQAKDWERAHATFEPTGRTQGRWHMTAGTPNRWPLRYQSKRLDLTFQLEMTKFKHVGIFPEQADNWEFIAEHLQPGQSFLNLFAYTGGASLAARQAGADVIHCDAIRQVIDWTRKNMESSGLDGIRWVVEDALKFAKREVKRGNTYDGIVLDPPTWGLGPKGEKWKLEDQLLELIHTVSRLVAPGGFVVMNTYSGLPPSALETMWALALPNASIQAGESCLRTSMGHDLPTGSMVRVVRS